MHAAAREGCLDVLQFLYGAGFDMTGAPGLGWGLCVGGKRNTSSKRDQLCDSRTLNIAAAALIKIVLLVTIISVQRVSPCAPSCAELDAERKSPLHHVPIGAGQTGLATRRGANHSQVCCDMLPASWCCLALQDCFFLHVSGPAGCVV